MNTGIETRICNKHGGEPLPISEFAGGSNNRTCKKCRNAKQRERYRLNATRIDDGPLSKEK
jgi:hypothetical protein